MKMPAALQNAVRKFDALSLRERALVSAGVLAVLFLAWDGMLMQPLADHETRLRAEMSDLQNGIADAASDTSTDPLQVAVRDRTALRDQIAATDAKLATAAAGLIPPERMIGVIRDVLAQQRALKLVSLHNSAVQPLAPAVPPAPSADAAQALPPVESGPYVHSVELIVEGNYFDVLAYLRALEALPWRFYWKTFDLSTTQYPTNRVRIELSTLSMDKAWLGV